MTKILVIDDDRLYLKLLEVLLKNSYPDYEISTAQSGPEGIEKAKKELPDIIILDIIMPDLDGYEVCKRLQSDEYTQHIPVILMTAYKTDSKDVIRGLESGALSFLSKPIGKDHLIARINVALRIRKAERALRESEEKFRNIIEMSSAGIATISLTGFITSCNPAFLKLTGFEYNDLVGKHFTKLPTLKLKDMPKYSRMMKSMTRGENLKPTEFNWVHKSGKDMVGEARLSVLKKKGKTTGFQIIAIDITKRKQTEEALRTSEAQLSNAMKIAKLGYWEYDVAEDLFTFNDHFYYIFRTSVEQVGGYTMSSARYAQLFVHPEDKQVVSTEIRKALETTDPNFSSKLEHRMIYTDGETGYIAVRFFIVKDDQGRTVRTFGANQDITERKKAEEAFREVKEFQSTLLNYSPNPIIVIEPDTTIKYVNPSLEKLTGFKSNKLVGKKAPYPYWPEELLEEIGEDLKKAMKKGTQRLEEIFQKKNGKKFWVEITSTPIKENGELKYFLSNWIDITKRKRAEQTLSESEENYRSLFENAVLGIYRTTPDGQIISVNPALLKMLRYSSLEELQHRNLEEEGFSHEYPRSKFKQKIEEEGIIVGMESEWLRADGITLSVRENAIAVCDSSGKVLYYEGTVEDITERKQAEEELKQKMKQLERFNKVAVDRELRMIELKREINELLEKAGLEKKYRVG